MFSVFDARLITVAQWIVRQVELYTNLQRKHLIESFFALFKWSSLVILPACTLLEILGSSLLKTALVVIITSLMMQFFAFYYMDMLGVYQSEVKDSVLPKAISTRRSNRFVALVLGIAVFVLYSADYKERLSEILVLIICAI